jgi:hypothetical protein
MPGFGMPHLRHAVVLEPIPRAWFDEHVELGHDMLTEHLGSATFPQAGGGEHLSPGSSYGTDEIQLTVTSWQPTAETSGQVSATRERVVATTTFRLVSATLPRLLELSANVRTQLPFGTRWMGKGSAGGSADLEAWWRGIAQEVTEPAIQGWLKHSMVRASFTVTPSPAPGGRWNVAVVAKVRGGGPFSALALLFGGRRLRRWFTDNMNLFAVEWNREVPVLLAQPPEVLRSRFTATLMNTES